MFENQGLLAIAFFEATAFIVLLVLFFLLRRDHPTGYFRSWFVGWCCLALSSVFEVGLAVQESPNLRLAAVVAHMAAFLIFLASAVQLTVGPKIRNWPVLPIGVVLLMGVIYVERLPSAVFESVRWETSILEAVISLAAGLLLWRAAKFQQGHGTRLLAGALLVSGLHCIDRPIWQLHPLFLLRVAFDHLLGVALGIAMVVVVLEGARSRTEELNDKMRRLTLLTAASTQTLSVKEVLHQVLTNLVESLGSSQGIVRMLEGDGKEAQLVARASVGFSDRYLEQHARIPASEPWIQRALQKDCVFIQFDDSAEPRQLARMAETGVTEVVAVALPGKDGPLGIVAVGLTRSLRFQADEISYFVNIANLLGLTLQNVRLFEQVDTVQQQWAYTFDSIGDPIFVHDTEFRVLRTNLRLNHLLGRDGGALIGRGVSDLLPRKGVSYKNCPYCEGLAGEGDDPDPWLSGYFLASNSTFTDPVGRQLGIVHALKDITDRKRAEEKYRTLVSNVQEGVFISTPQGRFLDFNVAFMRMVACENREELLGLDIPSTYVNVADRERLKKLLQEHGAVSDYEFDIRRRDGEVRTMMESSIAVRDSDGNVSAIQGFVLDITERKRAEQEIRRRNRELMVLNSISQTLTESMDLSDSLHRTLRQITELFGLDASSLYLFDTGKSIVRRIAAVGHRLEHARTSPQMALKAELLQQIRMLHATFISAQALPFPPEFREALRKEGLVSAFVVILWSKDRVIGGLVLASRMAREFSPADINLLIAVGSQISSAIDRSLLHEETRQAYDDLRRTQEQLLHSEKMAAVGQLISGVAHELNNPLTAILGYSQLLISSGQTGTQGIEYAEKLYKQAQRTHRIVQNLLSSARQHKPERMAVQINQILEDTLALRDYDLRMSNVRVHMDLASQLPVTAADPHQLQQVFLNLVNNAVDAVLERSSEGEIWVTSGVSGDYLFVEFTDSGAGVHDPSRVFDPFYTTKPVGKGTGLGLSICYGIVTEHGGTIRVRNLPPRGACFRMELPFQLATTAGTPSGNGVVLSGRGARILLADEDDSILEAVSAILRGREHLVVTVKSGAEAKASLQTGEFDLVLADAEIAKKFCSEGLQAWLASHKPILAGRLVTMFTSGNLEDGGDSVGVDGPTYIRSLQKPFEASELLAAIDAALSDVYASPIEH
ncbi:MAG TPA: PAS domain S-box protein [Candidatus Acidoferrum sp.]